jgi:hypothetical protein
MTIQDQTIQEFTTAVNAELAHHSNLILKTKDKKEMADHKAMISILNALLLNIYKYKSATLI